MKKYIYFVLLLCVVSTPAWSMDHYSNVAQDQNGRAIAGATVTVYLAGTTGLAPIYSDNGGTVKANPFTTAVDGIYDFYAADGRYDITISKLGYTSIYWDPNKLKGISLFDSEQHIVPFGNTFPAAPTIGEWFVLTSSDGASCNELSGSSAVPCRWNGSAWGVMGGSGGGGGGAGTLDQAFDGGKIIDGANSLANAVRIGDGVTPLCIFTDATRGPLIKGCTDTNARTFIWTNFTWCLYDIEGESCILTVDPDATDNDKYIWASGYRPIKTISLAADALYVAGAAALVTDTALISGGLVSPYITVTDSNSDYFYRYLVMDPKWDGGTVTATVTVVNVNGTPANAFEVDVSGACYPSGTVIPTTISTTGEQPATITFGASGSCGGSACNQNDPASATTAAITLNGTPAGGNVCAFQAQVDATATTETVAGIKVISMDIHWKQAKGF